VGCHEGPAFWPSASVDRLALWACSPRTCTRSTCVLCSVDCGIGPALPDSTGRMQIVHRQLGRTVRPCAPSKRLTPRHHVTRGRPGRRPALATEISPPGDSTATGDRSHTTDCVVIGSGIGGEGAAAVHTLLAHHVVDSHAFAGTVQGCAAAPCWPSMGTKSRWWSRTTCLVGPRIPLKSAATPSMQVRRERRAGPPASGDQHPGTRNPCRAMVQTWTAVPDPLILQAPRSTWACQTRPARAATR
jgi:hypothetical protein